MILPYRKIFKQAYEIVWNNKFLWIFGLFLLFGNFFNFNYVFQSQGTNSGDLSWFQNHAFLGNLTLLIVLGVILELILLLFKARAGNIIAVKAIIDRQETSFVKSFNYGGLFHLRLLGVFLLMQIALFLALVVIGGPIFYLFSLKFFIRALILSAIGLIIFIPISVIAALISFLAPMFVVLHDFKIGEAIQRSFELVSQFWFTLLVFSFMLFCLAVLAFLASLIAAAITALPFVLLAYLAYHKVGFGAGVALTIVSVTAGSIVFLIIQALVATFAQTAWVLAFLELIKPQKLEEEESLPVPEIV
ncbi:MAG: hypothetical protein WDN47_04115 [Candidatus Doudnabacteria bacterium]